MAKILAVCRSDKRGTPKDDIREGRFMENYGMDTDAHADSSTHRQVSLIAIESVNKMRDLGYDVGPGSFAENLTTEGIDLVSLPVGTRVTVGDDIVLEISQIGKECHTRCAIFKKMGECIMPTEGVFARVIRGGTARTGDEIKAGDNEERYH
jgi:MOSC domain-containing protein YiiM